MRSLRRHTKKIACVPHCGDRCARQLQVQMIGLDAHHSLVDAGFRTIADHPAGAGVQQHTSCNVHACLAAASVIQGSQGHSILLLILHGSVQGCCADMSRSCLRGLPSAASCTHSHPGQMAARQRPRTAATASIAVVPRNRHATVCLAAVGGGLHRGHVSTRLLASCRRSAYPRCVFGPFLTSHCNRAMQEALQRQSCSAKATAAMVQH
jgi:hypothetical protein